jgi:kynurenine formamidase
MTFTSGEFKLPRVPGERVSAEEFQALFDEVRAWGAWGERSERGAVNEITPERVLQAARLVRTGETVSLAQPLSTQEQIDVPTPADHHMTLLPEEGSGSLRFAKDYVGLDYHNENHSHIDAFSHVAFEGHFFGGEPAEVVTEQGAEAGSIELLKNGLIGRGVLLDIPRARSVLWLEPGESVVTEDLWRAERDQELQLEAGDVLLVRTGHARRRAELPPWDSTKAKPGLHPNAARFLAERRIAALGSDGNNDTAPSACDGVDFPIHVLALNAMGVYLFDYLQLEELAAACERAGRWEFLFVAAPLRIRRGTGSPLNPIAVF